MINDGGAISENILESFDVANYSFDMTNFRETYTKIINFLPPRNSLFSELSLENAIGCEVICAAICHQINWDFLRSAIYEKTKLDLTWMAPQKISKITPKEVAQLLEGYNRPERIREKERAFLLRSLGNSLLELNYSYSDIFFLQEGVLRNAENILNIIKSMEAFAHDPEEKKIQLLLQNLSEYESLFKLSKYCKPAVDYHIIREFLRRGLVIPKNQPAHDFIFNPNIERKERTVAGLRKLCSETFYTLQWITSCDIITLNTIEWWIGRSVCLKECPDCELQGEKSQWLKPAFSKCPFYESCFAIQSDKTFLTIVEPNYQGNSY